MREGKMKQRFTRFASLILAASVTIPLASAIPGIRISETVRAAGWTKSEENSFLGTSKIMSPVVNEDPNVEWKGNYVLFGHFCGYPIFFRVLDPCSTEYGGKTMFLDSDEVITETKHDEKAPFAIWGSSDIRKHLNEEFYESAFSEAEKAAIHESVKASGPAYPNHSWGNYIYTHFVPLTGEKIFLLDAQELMNPAYGYSADSGYTYVSSNNYSSHSVPNREKYMMDTETKETWWIRSTVMNSYVANTGAGVVRNNGVLDGVAISSTVGSNGPLGVAPALNIKLDSVVLSTLTNGEIGSPGAVFKLTVKDENMSVSIPSGKSIRYDFVHQRQVHVPYEVTGSNGPSANRMSVLITDGEWNAEGTSIIYYDKLDTGDSFSASGEGTFTVPYMVDEYGTWGVDYHVYIFPECDYYLDSTDYAGNFYEIKKQPYSDLVYDLRNGWMYMTEDLSTALGVAYYCGLINMETESGNTYLDIDKDGTRDVVIPYDKYNERTERLESCSVSGKKVLKNDHTKAAGIASFTFILPEVINNVSITLDAPVAGKKPSYDPKLPSGAKYYFMTKSYETSKNDITWSDLTGSTTLKVDKDVFKVGRVYSIYMDVTAKDGYVFDFPASKVKVTLNGKTMTNVTFEDNGQLCIMYDFPQVKATPTPTKKPATPTPTKKPATPTPTKKPATPTPTKKPATPTPTKKPATPTPTKKPSTPTPTKKPATPTPVSVGRVTGLTAVKYSYNSVYLSWNTVSGASGYELLRATSENGTYTLVKSQTGTTKIDADLTSGKTYYYKVRAFKTVNGTKHYGAYSAVANCTPALAAPYGVSAKASSPTTVDIAWKATAETQLIEVWRTHVANAEQKDYVCIGVYNAADGASVSKLLTPNKTYYYKLRGYVKTSDGKKVYSGYSAVVSAKPSVSVTAPSGLKVTATTKDTISLSWNKVSGSNIMYEMWRMDAEGVTPGVCIGRYADPSCISKKLSAGKTYYYRVRAYYFYYDGQGELHRVYGNYSTIVSGKTKT